MFLNLTSSSSGSGAAKYRFLTLRINLHHKCNLGNSAQTIIAIRAPDAAVPLSH
jgi:hypothetical protein